MHIWKKRPAMGRVSSGRSRLKRVVLGSMLICAIFVLWYGESIVNPQEKFFSLTAPIHKIFRFHIFTLNHFFYGIAGGSALADRLRIYQKENEILYAHLVKLRTLQDENEVLRSALGIKEYYAIETIPASVLSFQSDGFEEILIIKWPKQYPVQEGMTVISHTGILAGRILSVAGSVGYVQLLSDPRTVFNGEVFRNGASGVIQGKGLGRMSLDQVEKTFDLKEGDLVMTNALGGMFEPGLSFGKIKEINESDLAAFRSASVESIIDPRFLRTVLVVMDSTFKKVAR